MSSIKRPEENCKFIFKRCLKHMREKLKTISGSSKNSKKDSEKFFVEYYFQEVAELTNQPIESFFHPQNSNQNSNGRVKTINSQYIHNISKSKKFMSDFMEYIRIGLEDDYKQTIKQKMKNICYRWEKDFRTSPDFNETIKSTCTNIEKNIKCKLPWTMVEVQSAIESVKQLFRDVV